MKQMAKTLISVALVVVSTVLPLSVSAGIFHYDFGVLEENDWELWGENSMWRVKEGFLRTTIQAPDFGMGLLQFKGIPGNYESFEIFADNRVIEKHVKTPGYDSFTITVKSLGSKSSNFGVAIGRRFPERPYFYIFYNYFIDTQIYNWDLPPSFWSHEVPLHPDTWWKTAELVSMEIRFNKGHFQWFVDDEKRAEFEDPDFAQIEIIGFMIQSNGIEVEVGSAWVDSFTISGPGLAVSPQAKLATKWGTLKRF